jgi:hypothetical protein
MERILERTNPGKKMSFTNINQEILNDLEEQDSENS